MDKDNKLGGTIMREDIKITRDQNGVPHIEAEDLNGLYMGQGYVHARDRGLQMLLMRILGKGRASELLDSGDDTLSIDIFFRRMNWRGNTETELEKLSPVIKGYLESYCEGVNTAWKEKFPWEFKLLKYAPEPWVPDDSIMMT
ncbi:MAG: penicillin acylase family protein, partial [Candidatus Aminicenantes bacterium]|nr:penicillin acylase family protein [Candidatus Aminicenantes bacterium]